MRLAAYAQAILACDLHSHMHTVGKHRVARSNSGEKPLEWGGSIAASSLLELWRQGFSRETASLLRGNFGGKVVVVGIHMPAT